MSTTVDNQIVRMQFDNTQFEKRTQESIKSINRMQEALRFSGSERGISRVSKAINAINLTSVVSQIDNLASHFSLFGISADQVIRNVTNKVMNMGQTIVDNLTLAPVRTGYQEYETQINATQTILANTQDAGKTIDDVTAALDDLNVYADKTIYNFTEMTRNIGTFTAAGVGLEDSVVAIKGIANLAAASGSNSEQASRAMYQLSQALSSGTVKLMDWNSVVNAGMGGKLFQDQLVKTGKEIGGASAKAAADIEAGKTTFRDSLQSGWLTSDVLLKTLTKFTDESTELGKTATDAATKVKTMTQLWDTTKEMVQSGWTQTWEWVIGDFEKAKTLLTKISDKIASLLNPAAEARNRAFEQWATQGIEDTTKETKKLKKETTDYATALASADKVIRDVINGKYGTGKKRKSALEAAGYSYAEVQSEVNKLVALRDKANSNGEDATEETDNILTGRDMVLKGLKNIWNTIDRIFTAIRSAFREIFPRTTGDDLIDFSKRFLAFTEKISVTRKNLISFGKTMENLKRTAAGVFAVFDIGIQFFKSLFKFVGKLLGLFPNVGDDILGFTGNLGDMIVKFDKSIKEGKLFENFFDGLFKTISYIPGKLKEFFSLDFAGKIEFIKEGFKSFFESVRSGWNDILSFFGKKPEEDTGETELPGPLQDIKDFIDNVRNADNPLEYIGNSLKSFFQKIKDAITNITPEDMTVLTRIFNSLTYRAALHTVRDLSAKLTEVFEGFNQIKDASVKTIKRVGDTVKTFQSSVKSAIILEIALAVSALVLSVKQLGELEKDKMESGIKGLAAVMGLLVLATLLIKKIFKTTGEIEGENPSEGLGTVGVLLTTFASAVIKIALAVALLSLIPEKNLEKGLNAIINIFAIVEVFLWSAKGVVSGATDLKGVALSVLSLGVSMTLLTAAIIVLAIIPKAMFERGYDNMVQISTIISLVMMLITQFGKKDMTKVSDLSGVAGVMLAFAVVLNAMLIPLIILGALPTKVIDQGMPALIVLSAVILVMTVVIQLISRLGSGQNKLQGVAGVMLMFGVVINLLVVPVMLLSLLPVDKIKVGIAGVLALMLGLTIFVGVAEGFSKNAKKVAGLGLTILEITAAIMLLMSALVVLDNIKNVGKVVGLFLMISGVLVAFTSLVLIGAKMENITSSAKAMVSMVVSLTIVMVIITGLLFLMTEFKEEDLNKAVNTFGKIVIILSILIGVLTVAAGILAIIDNFRSKSKKNKIKSKADAKSTEKSSSRVAKLMKTLTKFIVVIALVVGSLGLLIDCLTKLGTIELDADKMDRNFTKIMHTLISATPLIAKFIASIIFGVVDLIVQSAGTIVQGFFDLLWIVRDAIMGNQGIFDLVGSIFSGLLYGLAGQLGPIADAAITMLVSIFQSMATAIQEHKSELGDAIAGFIVALCGLWIAIVQSLLNAIAEALVGESFTSWFQPKFNTFMDWLTGDWATYWEDIGETVYDKVQEIKGWIQEVLDYLEAMVAETDAFYYWKVGMGISTEADERAYEQRQNEKENKKESKERKKEFKERKKEVDDETREMARKWNTDERYGDIGDIRTREEYEEWKRMKQSKNHNERTTLRKEVEYLKKRAEVGLTSDLENQFLTWWGIHSPSKVMEKYGGYLDEGLALGIEGGTNSVLDAMDVLDQAISDEPMLEDDKHFQMHLELPPDELKKLQDSLSDVKEAFSDENLGAEVDTSVKPVLDMSDTLSDEEVQRYKDKLNAELGEGYSVNSPVKWNIDLQSDTPGVTYENLLDDTWAHDQSIDISKQDIVDNNYDDSQLLELLQGMDGDIQDLSWAFKNQNIYLDTGAIAGGVAPKVDNLLAQAGARSARVKGAYAG